MRSRARRAASSISVRRIDLATAWPAAVTSGADPAAAGLAGLPRIEDLAAAGSVLCEVEGHEQHVGALVHGCTGDEGRRLDGDARASGLPRHRSESSLEGADLGRVGDVQIGRAVGCDGHRRAELRGGDRSTEHAGAFRWCLGQCDSCRVPHLGERPEKFGDQRTIAVDERSFSDRCEGLARGAHREAGAAREVPDTDGLTRVEQERRGNGDASAAAYRIAGRAGPRGTGVRLDVEVEVKRLIPQVEVATPIEEPDAGVAELRSCGMGELISDHDEQPGTPHPFEVSARLHRIDTARGLHLQFEGPAARRANHEVGGAVCGERWDASGGERRGHRFDR
jgi:hypothetical protein